MTRRAARAVCLCAAAWGAVAAAHAQAQAQAQALAAASAPAAWLELQLVGGVLPPAQRLISVLKGDALRLRIRSDAAGELHLHAYRLSVALQPGQPAELTFTAHASGRFRFEWHAASAQRPVPPADHHAAPLAVLEVRPR